MDEPNIAVLPGYWRIGLSHTKAKSLFLRFATKEDKKVRGAEKNSLFYKKNGNPNYGGLKGLISSSKKRKFKASHTRRMVNELSSNKKSLNEDLLPSGFQARTKTIKMTMYADEEEEALRRREKSKKINNPRSVKSRIGAKYDKIQLGQLGKQISDNEDTTTETLSVTCKIPSNFGNNIWEDQSRQMAEEDEKYSHKNHHYDSSASSDSEETERYYAFRSERAQYDAKMNNLNPILYQDTFKSSRGMPETKADLRSRINKLKMESSLNKHRSPLCRDDSE